jgi:hypothetical protein
MVAVISVKRSLKNIERTMFELLANVDPTTITILGGVVTGLSTAIGVLWKHISANIARLEALLLDCQDDRERLWGQLAKQCGKDVSELKGDDK